MAVKIGHARGDENGNTHGGKAGDQTGKEVCISDYYEHKKGWRVLRAVNEGVREKIAMAMERACGNDNIGYDQWQRDTLLNAVKNYGYDPAAAKTLCETDCSALVRVCCAYAFGFDLVEKFASGSRFSTANMAVILLKTNLFCEVTDGTKERGDILVTKTQGHTAVVLSDLEIKKEMGWNEMNIMTLRKGMTGSYVKSLQILLAGLGYDLGKYGADGDFGSATEKAVKNLQKNNALDIDGIVGRNTWSVLLGYK